jgi:hypothetical protein
MSSMPLKRNITSLKYKIAKSKEILKSKMSNPVSDPDPDRQVLVSDQDPGIMMPIRQDRGPDPNTIYIT